MILALLLAAQTAAVPLQPASPPQRLSILASDCPKPTGEEITVCAPVAQPRLPLPAERGPPDHPVPSNPDLRPTTAMNQTAAPCASLQGGCQTGIDVLGGGTAAIRLIGKLIDPDSCCERPGESTSAGMLIGDMVGGIKRAFAKKPDKSNRVSVALDTPPPSTAGRLLP
ncbi:hypothetical protein [Sphingomonas mollis]|uniref:Uncharacterized protein n=1 Tax=Sphingomonas mollis TaxID=2795726 RepID=A0ABS0XKU4_9SPHN|nr:hypothetical protein [Sphingomonas sp. BT553]MBJ6120333.1 hypothetical protein [Sphingomonas sp. BT553]